MILPDAYKEAATSALAGAAFGAAGQRCMAVSAAVFVGGIDSWKDSLIEKAKKLVVGPGNKEGVDVGPMITPEAKQRAIELITQAENDVSPREPVSVLVILLALSHMAHAGCNLQTVHCRFCQCTVACKDFQCYFCVQAAHTIHLRLI